MLNKCLDYKKGFFFRYKKRNFLIYKCKISIYYNNVRFILFYFYCFIYKNVKLFYVIY